MCTEDRGKIVLAMCFCHTSLVNLNLITKMEMRRIFYSNTNHFQHRHWTWVKMKATGELERIGVETGAGSTDKWCWSVNEARVMGMCCLHLGNQHTLRAKKSVFEHLQFSSLVGGLNGILHNHATTVWWEEVFFFSDPSKKSPERVKK